VGNDHVKVTAVKPAPSKWELPMVRWVKAGGGLNPDFGILEKYLDAYLKYCAPPRALTLYVWSPSTATEIADAYENRRIPSRAYERGKLNPTVTVWDPATKTSSEVKVPRITEEGAEAFYKPLVDGVRELVLKRGWSERIVMLGLGYDVRPSQRTGELVRKWAPYARWDLLSHFSGDPEPKDGKWIATGGLEVGLAEFPWMFRWGDPRAVSKRVGAKPKEMEFLQLPTDRWKWQEYSPPLVFRTVVPQNGHLGSIGLDFWHAKKPGQPNNATYWVQMDALTLPGPDGAVPTVRFQMLRQGVQEWEARASILKALEGLPPERQKTYGDLFDELSQRMLWGTAYLSQHELSYDWPGYTAQVYWAASELIGVPTGATWDRPPK